MILLMPSRAGASLLLFCLEYKVDPKAVCQCPLGLVPHCYLEAAKEYGDIIDIVSMPSRASTSLLLS